MSSSCSRVDPRTWRACAGACVRVPPLHSRVYYFPQGHLEQQPSFPGSAPSSARLDPRFVGRAALPCVVTSVDFEANCETDEVFVRFGLRPDAFGVLHRGWSFVGRGADYFDNEEGVLTYAKKLTPSDANNGGGFSVPRSCAGAIFPELNFRVDRPVQVLSVRDTNGVVWNFRHVYRGRPSRHLLTTGWSKFVNSKMLIAGDTVIFIRDAASASNEMSVGIRRASKASNEAKGARWRLMLEGVNSGSGDNQESLPNGLFGSSREEEEVVWAMEKWLAGEEFEVVYYPTRVSRGGGTAAEFVVVREVVEAATGRFWEGAWVKMAVESEDCSGVTSLWGRVARVEIPQEGTWQGSPWRMLQMTWDELSVVKDKNYVNPWQVEVVIHASSPRLPVCYQPEFRFPEQSGCQGDGDVDSRYPLTGYSNMTVGHLNPPLVDNNTPFSMQGARQDDPSAIGSLPYIIGDAPMRMDNDIDSVLPESDTTSTVLNMASSRSGSLSPDSPMERVHSFHGEGVHRGEKTARTSEVGSSSFLLFGQIIHARHAEENSPAVATGVEDNGKSNGKRGPSGSECTDH